MPMSSTVTTFAGITRNTPTDPLRSRAAFTRKRASPAISYAKSVSPDSRHSTRFRSGMIDSRRRSSCSPDRGSSPCRTISPWVRKIGGSSTRRWRSDDLECTSACSSSPSCRWAPSRRESANSAGSAPGAFVEASIGGGATTTDNRGFRPPDGASAAGGGAGSSAGESAMPLPASTPGVIWACSLPFFGVTRTMTRPAPPAYSNVAPAPLPIRSAASLGAISVSRAYSCFSVITCFESLDCRPCFSIPTASSGTSSSCSPPFLRRRSMKGSRRAMSSVRGARVQYVRAVHQMGGVVGGHGEEGTSAGIEVVYGPGHRLRQHDLRDAVPDGAVDQRDLESDLDRSGRGLPARGRDGESDGLGPRHEEHFLPIVGQEGEEPFGTVQHLERRFRPFAGRGPRHHEHGPNPFAPLGQEESRVDRFARERETAHGGEDTSYGGFWEAGAGSRTLLGSGSCGRWGANDSRLPALGG